MITPMPQARALSAPLRWLPGWWDAAGADERLLLLLCVCLAALVLVTLALATAVLLLRLRLVRRRRLQARRQELWTPTLLDVLSRAAPASEMDELVGRKESLWFVGFLAEYARRVRGEERGLLRALARPHLTAVFPRLRHRSAEVRARAVQTVALLGAPEHERWIVAALDDADEIVAATAALGLARAEHGAHAAALLRRIELFQAWDRGFVPGILAGVGPALAMPLRKLLAERGRAPRLRAMAADALSLLNDLPTADLAAATLEQSPDRELAAACLRVLAQVGVARHAGAARAHLDDGDALLRAHAAAALGRLGEPADAEALLALLQDPDAWVALRAALALRQVGAGDVLAPLAGGTSSPPDGALALPGALERPESGGVAVVTAPSQAGRDLAVLAREVLALEVA
ncbi:MAG TPA: HEAT repeat domain-containing protein [Longimicrobiales bacterium]